MVQTHCSVQNIFGKRFHRSPRESTVRTSKFQTISRSLTVFLPPLRSFWKTHHASVFLSSLFPQCFWTIWTIFGKLFGLYLRAVQGFWKTHYARGFLSLLVPQCFWKYSSPVPLGTSIQTVPGLWTSMVFRQACFWKTRHSFPAVKKAEVAAKNVVRMASKTNKVSVHTKIDVFWQDNRCG